MANAGFRVKGALGTAQIDSNYSNFELVASGTIYLTSGGTEGRYADFSLPSGELFPVVALAGAYSCWSVMISDTVCRVYAIVSGGISPPINYYVFGTPKPTSSGAGGIIGLRVRNPTTGNIAYSSERRYMKILDRRSGTLGRREIISGSVSGKTIAVAVQMRPYFWLRRTVSQGQPVVTVVVEGGRGICSGGSWQYTLNTINATSTPGTQPTLSYEFYNYSFLILDVTGY